MKTNSMRRMAVVGALCASMLLLLGGCKSEEQIAAGVQSTTGIRDVVYNEAPEVVMSTIVVKGSGEIKTVPDTASITFNVRTKDKDAVTAQAQNEEIIQALLEVLKTDSIAEKDIKTANISMYEQFDYSKNEPVLTGYEASNNVKVTIRDVANISTIIADALTAGVTSYDGLTFSVTDTAGDYDKALAAAVEDAGRKAAAIAEAAGLELSGTMKIEEQSVSQPALYREAAAADGAMNESAAAGAGPSVSMGEVTTQAELVVTYEVQKAK
ncbi:MAG: SIMPL domain-containing protein [Clostridia bacterium]|nr:SIMPL domain-containing protein [Clostridia bacterium]